ncbi:MAG TPA: hypothetical protein VHY32_02700 [Caulobacteraceae bacterium]|nr:hypothetical protein [Caulobacteraceae bacterium]
MDASPDAYPLGLDLASAQARVIPMTEAVYRAASFHNDQLLARTGPGRLVPWAELRAAASRLDGESDFIFHIGHVGSTLLSRILGDHERVFALREPPPLRALAIAEAGAATPQDARRVIQTYLPSLSRLYARVYRPGQRGLVKATSFVGEIGPALLDHAPSAQAILMFATPATYLTTMLSSAGARADLAPMAGLRLARLNRRIGGTGWAPPPACDGERAALGWASEVRALVEIADRYPDRILWLDIDEILNKPARGLAAALHRLHGAAPEDAVATLAASPHFSRYAKAPEHAYDAALRGQILGSGWNLHRAEIERGFAWLKTAAAGHSAIAAAARRIASLPKLS